jgi:UDP-N-acetylmuramoyl-tripeptide--D-alanyl-D-alanine ligase
METAIPGNRAALTAWWAAAAAEGKVLRVEGDGRRAFGILSDSRAATAGCAFVALRGPRHDGHDHVERAVACGAVVVLVERGRGRSDWPCDVVEVDDTLLAWGALARAHLREWRRFRRDTRTVAITGSAGKTTTKELCAALLREAGPCLASPGNLNNRVGVPAVAFVVDDGHRFAVLEVGMSLPGEIAALADVVEPDVAVLTNVGVAHAAGVGGDRAAVAHEKGALFAGLGPGSVAVVSADDPVAHAQLARTRAARSITFGLDAAADYRLVARASAGLGGSRLRVRRRDGSEVAALVPLVGEAAAVDFCAALAACEAAAGPLDEATVARALASGLSMPSRRMQVRQLASGTTLLDDTYNANPSSVRAALQTLGEVASGRPTVIVLGEMRELGTAGLAEHEGLGPMLATSGARLLVSCGGLADHAVDAARSRGIAAAMCVDAIEAAAKAPKLVAPGDVVLVKASRGIGAERVVEALVAAGGGERATGGGPS